MGLDKQTQDTDTDPAPGPDDPVPTWPEFEALRDAVEQYIEHDAPDPTFKHLSHALGAILGELIGILTCREAS